MRKYHQMPRDCMIFIMEQKEIFIPNSLVRPAMTVGERKRLMYEARLRYENGADDDTEIEDVRWY